MKDSQIKRQQEVRQGHCTQPEEREGNNWSFPRRICGPGEENFPTARPNRKHVSYGIEGLREVVWKVQAALAPGTVNPKQLQQDTHV